MPNDNSSYTLFSVTKENRQSRSERIRSLFNEQPALGYLLAVFDFEWTVRRAVLLLSKCPITVIKARFESKHYSGWATYQGCWTKCVQKTRDDVMPSLCQIIFAKDANTDITKEERALVQKAMQLRHQLVHGLSGSIPSDKASVFFPLLLMWSERITTFVDGIATKPMFARASNPLSRCMKCKRRNRCRFPRERQAANEAAERKKRRRIPQIEEGKQ